MQSEDGVKKSRPPTWRRAAGPADRRDLEVDAEELLAVIEEVWSATGAHVSVTHLVGHDRPRAGREVRAQRPQARRRFEREDVAVFFVVAVDDGRDLSGVKVREADPSRRSRSPGNSPSGRRGSGAGEDADFGRSKKLLARTPT